MIRLFAVLLMVTYAMGLGEFVATCPMHTRSPDDALVYFNQPGKSHMHDFYGAKNIAANARPIDMRNSGTSCNPGLDHSAYWTPSLIKNGNYITAEKVTIYYHSFGNFDKVQPMPLGLSIIARQFNWSCKGGGGNFKVSSFPIPDCGSNELEVLINYPQCWNGKDLDSADHMSHMTYATANTCPSSHPVLLPRLQFKITYPTNGGAGTTLSSGDGQTAHGDFVNGWEPAAMQLRVNQCLRKNTKCKNNLLGDQSITPTLGDSVPPPVTYSSNPGDGPTNGNDQPTNPITIDGRLETSSVLIPEGDSYVQGGDFSTENYGDLDQLIIQAGNTSSDIQESYITFNMDSLDANSRIENCKLELTVNPELSDASAVDINMGIVEQTWSEDTLTYATRPPSTESIVIHRPQNVSVLDTDVTELCKAAYQTNKKFSVRLYMDEVMDVNPLFINSRESGYTLSPKLIVLTSPAAILQPFCGIILLIAAFLALY